MTFIPCQIWLSLNFYYKLSTLVLKQLNTSQRIPGPMATSYWQVPGHFIQHRWPGSTPLQLVQKNLVLVVQSQSRTQLFVTPWTAARQASLSFTISWNLLKLISIELVMPSNCLVLCHPLLLLPSIFLSIRVFSNESVLRIRWPKYWSFSFSFQWTPRTDLL